ncbi:hypothetical protein Btru_060681 [Bulinus truncatus]|nr:hypothetical protein Btru_060681 [Bulinus truncatus]
MTKSSETNVTSTMPEITSEHLNELPTFLYSRMPPGKKCTGECVRKHHKSVTVYLLDADLWKRFTDVGTEMIITKKGRRVFPVPSYMICDLDHDKLYNVTLQIQSVDNAIHKYLNNEWITCKEGAQFYPTPVPGRNTYLHPYSPNTGAHWMREPITFSGLKISNNLDALGTIVLQSMRKYQMILIISELSGSMDVHIPQPETQFVAVTQYQNEQVTQMKIEHNPFANGFRFASNKKDKFKQQIPVEDDNDSISNDLSPQRSPKILLSSTPKSDVNTNQTLYQEQSHQQQVTQIKVKEPAKKTTPQTSNSYSSADPNSSHRSSLYGSKNRFVPSSETMGIAKTFALSKLMFSPAGVNPLAQVRNLGRRPMESDITPLALVKKKKTTDDSRESLPKTNFKRPLSESQQRPAGSLSDEARRSADPFKTIDMRMFHDADYLKWFGYPVSPSFDAMGSYQESPTDLSKKTNNIQNFVQEKSSTQCLKPEITLKNRELWETTHEVVVSAEGRLMFPYIALSISNLEMQRQYFISLELIPASKWLYDYVEHEWTPSLEISNDFRVSPYQHPENPKSGKEWESGIVFDRIRLSTARQGKNIMKVQLRRQYYPVIVIRTGLQTWQYCLKDAMFITVSIDRSQYLQKKTRDGVTVINECFLSRSEVIRSSQRKQSNPKKMSHESFRTESEICIDGESHQKSDPQPEESICARENINPESDGTLATNSVSTVRPCEILGESSDLTLNAHDHGILDMEETRLYQNFRNWHTPYWSDKLNEDPQPTNFLQPSAQTAITSHAVSPQKSRIASNGISPKKSSIASNATSPQKFSITSSALSPQKCSNYTIFQLSSKCHLDNSVTNDSEAVTPDDTNVDHVHNKENNSVNDSVATDLSYSCSTHNEMSEDNTEEVKFSTNLFLFKEEPSDMSQMAQLLCPPDSKLCISSDSVSKLR